MSVPVDWGFIPPVPCEGIVGSNLRAEYGAHVPLHGLRGGTGAGVLQNPFERRDTKGDQPALVEATRQVLTARRRDANTVGQQMVPSTNIPLPYGMIIGTDAQAGAHHVAQVLHSATAAVDAEANPNSNPNLDSVT